jgi:hypothetical protein
MRGEEEKRRRSENGEKNRETHSCARQLRRPLCPWTTYVKTSQGNLGNSSILKIIARSNLKFLKSKQG